MDACRDDQLEAGFTILELIVVLVIIAALMAIAVPTFLSARATANDRAAQSDLRTALVAANTVYIDAQSFENMTVSDLSAAEPSIRWEDGPTTVGPHTLGVDLTHDIASGNEDVGQPAILLVEDAGDGECFYAVQADQDSPYYGEGPQSGGQCNADQAVNVPLSRTL
jgi:type IV pilus assembly protein PilA